MSFHHYCVRSSAQSSHLPATQNQWGRGIRVKQNADEESAYYRRGSELIDTLAHLIKICKLRVTSRDDGSENTDSRSRSTSSRTRCTCSCHVRVDATGLAHRRSHVRNWTTRSLPVPLARHARGEQRALLSLPHRTTEVKRVVASLAAPANVLSCVPGLPPSPNAKGSVRIDPPCATNVRATFPASKSHAQPTVDTWCIMCAPKPTKLIQSHLLRRKRDMRHG